VDPPQAWGRPDLNDLRKEYREYSQRSLDKCFSYLNFYVGLLAALLAATLTGLLQAQAGTRAHCYFSPDRQLRSSWRAWVTRRSTCSIAGTSSRG
jgi:hypothetical protein